MPDHIETINVHDLLDAQRRQIIAHLEAEAERRPRARAFTRGILHAADEIRAGFDVKGEVPHG